MKWLNIVLSIYLVALACLPCADVEINSAGHSLTAHQSDEGKHSHDKNTDLCSPFCICNCCGAQILNYTSVISYNFSFIATDIKTQQPHYKSVSASNFYGSIWQPPQIV